MISDILSVLRIYGVCFMFEDLKKDKIIVELRLLLDSATHGDEIYYDEDLDAYCTFMKDVILSTSGLN